MEQRRSSQSFKRKELVAKLNATGVRAFKAAADTAKLRGNPYVELVHFIQQLVLSERSDVQMIIADAGIDAGKILKAALAEVGGRGGGSSRIAQGSVADAAALERVLQKLPA